MSVEADDAEKSGRSGFGDMVRVVIHALILAMIVRVFFYQPFNIPSGSMVPTLLIGDYLFVSKFSYGYSRYSFPFSPNIGAGRIWSSEPERGDVAVFKLPLDNETDYIKRVVGLPGDEVQMIGGTLHINGKAVKKEPLDVYEYVDKPGNTRRARRYKETLPNGVEYTVLDEIERGPSDNTRVFKVPAGHFFMMGDNRDNSSDSRMGVGYVPLENFVGRAEIIFFSGDHRVSFWQVWRWPTAIRWSRIVDLVD